MGLVLEYGVLFGGLLPFMGSEHKLRFDFMDVVQNLEHDLQIRGVAPRTVERARAYYQELWKRTKGIKVANLFNTLPLSLRKELMLDCFWDVFKHSSLLADLPIEVKRSLSMVMEHEYYLPGEILFRAGNTKTKLVYIVSGIVDVVAVEDENIAVASFTAGTCISEISLAFLHKGKNTIRCATVCVVQTLYTYDVMEVLENYPLAAAEVAEHLVQRVQLAKEVRSNAEALQPKALNPLDELAITPLEIKWVKDQWRKIFEMESLQQLRQTSSAQNAQELGTRSYKSRSFKVLGAGPRKEQQSDKKTSLLKSLGLGDEGDDYTSRSAHTCVYFDLFVLAEEEQKAEDDLVCARVNFPWILKTESDFTYIWEFISDIVVVYECYIIPFYLSFWETFPWWVQGYGVFCDVILVFDVAITMITAVPEVPAHFFPTVGHRFQTLDFYLRIFIAVPWHAVGILLGQDEYDSTRLRYLRMACIVKLIRLFNKWAEKAGDLQYVIKYPLVIVSLIYWMACFEHLLSCYRNICGGRNWYVLYLQYIYSLGMYSESLSSKVLDMLFYVASNFLRIAFMTTKMIGLSGFLMVDMLMFISIFTTTYFLSEFCSLQMIKNRNKRRFMDLLEKIELYHVDIKIPRAVYQQLTLFIKFQWRNNPNLNMLEDTYEATLPDYLFTDIHETAREVVRTIPLFANASADMVEELAKKVTFYHCPKSIQLLRAGEHTAAVYVLRRGFCRAVSHWQSDIERNMHWTFSVGDCFPLMEVMHKVPSILTVTTDTACVLAMIDVHQLEHVLAKFPVELQHINAVLQAHNAVWKVGEMPLEGVQGNPWEKERDDSHWEHMPHFMKQKFNFFRFQRLASHQDAVEDSTSEEENEGSLYEEEEADYEKAWKQSRIARILRMFLREESFDPAGQFVFRWEMVRSTLAVVACLLHPCAYGAFVDSSVARGVCNLLDVYCLVDMYVRLQIGYYNEEGVLIIHPALTSTSYLKHSFTADLLSCLPLEILIVDWFQYTYNKAKMHFYARIFRLVQIYRFFQFINNLDERVSYSFFSANITMVIVGIMVALNAVANLFMYQSCDVETKGYRILYFKEVILKCNFDDVMVDTFLKMVLITPLEVYLLNLYYVVSLYIGSVDGLFVFHRFRILLTLFASVITFLARNWIIATVTSNTTTTRWEINKSRHVLEQMMSFLRQEEVDEKLVRITKDAFDLDWSRRRGFKITEVLKKVPPLLQADVLFHRCAQSLYLVAPLQGANEFLLRELSRNIQLHLLNKGRYVFRKNDVQDYVYILDFGLLEVIGAGNESLCSLSRGAIFGNLPRQQRMRHTCGILVCKNSVVFSLSNDVFYNMIEKFPEIHHRFDQVQEAQLEYFPHLGYDPHERVPSETKTSVDLEATRRDIIKNSEYSKSLYLSGRSLLGTFHAMWKKGVLKMLGQTFLMYFVITPSVICVLLNSALRNDQHFFIVVIYMCDSFYVVKIISTFWYKYRATKDSSMGKYYFGKNIAHPFALPLDVISTIPLELLFGLRCLRVNRIARLITFYQIYKWKYNRLRESLKRRWFRIFVLLALLLSFLACFYILVRCDVGRYCEYLRDLKQIHKSFFRVGIRDIDMITLAYLYSISRFTTASFTEPPIYTVGGLLYNLVISIADHVLMVLFVSHIACLMCVSRKYRSDFQYLLDKMIKRLKIMSVSESLYKKSRTYFSNIWRDEMGYSMPSWLKSGPRDLRVDLMATMYGRYLQKDPVLGHGHEDLLFQIAGYLQRSVYYPNDTIAERGDVDGRLFILQTGEVKVVAPAGNFLEAVIFKVPPGHLFGVKSGLFEGKPHEFTYRATKKSVVLILQQKDWKYLLEFFPSSAKNIITQAKNASL